MLGGSQPKIITTHADGSNNVEIAKAATWDYYLKDGDEDDDFFYWDFEDELENFVDDFNDSSKYVNFYIYTLSGVPRGIYSGLTDEMIYVAAFIAVLSFLFIFAQLRLYTKFSRMLFSLIVIFVNELSYYEGTGLMCLTDVNATGYEGYYHFASFLINLILISYVVSTIQKHKNNA